MIGTALILELSLPSCCTLDCGSEVGIYTAEPGCVDVMNCVITAGLFAADVVETVGSDCEVGAGLLLLLVVVVIEVRDDDMLL